MAIHRADVGVGGRLDLRVLPRFEPAPLAWRIENWRRYRARHWAILQAARAASKLSGAPLLVGRLYLKTIGPDGRGIDYGLVSEKVVTDDGCEFIVDAWQNSVEMENMKYHGFGTGTTAAVVGDAALETEMTTQYATDNTRPTGTTAEASAQVFSSVATFSPDSGGTIAITEHGVLSQAATGGGVLFDRHVFAAVNVVAGSDSIQSTYEATFASGG